MDTSLLVNIQKKIILLCGIKKGWKVTKGGERAYLPLHFCIPRPRQL
jgi:hypothetical protein